MIKLILLIPLISLLSLPATASYDIFIGKIGYNKVGRHLGYINDGNQLPDVSYANNNLKKLRRAGIDHGDCILITGDYVNGVIRNIYQVKKVNKEKFCSDLD